MALVTCPRPDSSRPAGYPRRPCSSPRHPSPLAPPPSPRARLASATLALTPIALALVALALLSLACSPPTEAEPFRTGAVSIEAVHTGLDAQGPYATIIYTVTNKDKETIHMSALSFEVKSSARRRIHEVRQETAIPAGRSSWFETRFALEDESVTVAKEDISLLSAVFQ